MRGRLAAITASLLAHGAAAVLLIVGLPWPQPTGAVDHGLQGIEISLAAGGAPGVQAPPPPEPEKSVPEKLEPEPEQKVELPAEPKPPPEAPPVIVSRAEDPVIEDVPKPDPKPQVQRRPPPKPRQEALKAVAESPKQASPPAAQPAETSVAAAPVSPGLSGQRPAPNAGSGSAASSGGNPGAEADYYATLLAWLERHKEYPRGAQLRRQQGVVHLRFTIDGTGKVLAYRLERSSGFDALDDAVERMIRKAEPLPPIPVALGKERLDVVVPVQFFLKQR